MAKFIYEAQREGIFGLQSGSHSPSPRLRQIDLDRDNRYPNSSLMSTYTKFKRRDYFGFDEDNADGDGEEATGIDSLTIPKNRVSLQSTERFTEGYNASDLGYAWKESASQYHVRSIRSSNGPVAMSVVPHLKLNPTDTLLTHGNWYSDARSEFMDADLDPDTGFVVKNINDGIFANITAGQNTITLDSIEGFQIGQILTKKSGTGAFSTSGAIVDILIYCSINI